jgi:hypothetical protein
MTMKTTYAQQAAAAARKGDYDNAHALYAQAAIAADNALDNAKSKRMWSQANRYERLAESA